MQNGGMQSLCVGLFQLVFHQRLYWNSNGRNFKSSGLLPQNHFQLSTAPLHKNRNLANISFTPFLFIFSYLWFPWHSLPTELLMKIPARHSYWHFSVLRQSLTTRKHQILCQKTNSSSVRGHSASLQEVCEYFSCSSKG